MKLVLTLALSSALFVCHPGWTQTDLEEQPARAKAAHEPHSDEDVGHVSEEEREDRPKAEFSIKFRDEVTPYDVTAVFVMPDETIVIETIFERGETTYAVKAAGGEIVAQEGNAWEWKAPSEPGLYPITVTADRSDHDVVLNAFVMVPDDEIGDDGKLETFRIGSYPETGEKANYENPAGFVRVTNENKDTLISPHFRIGQFVSKQTLDHPMYVSLQERLILKLEMLRHEFAEAGIEVDTLHIMSGYRTPYYNASIGNVQYSRHVFGDAADLFIDNNGDWRMDDLNGDGESDYADVLVLQKIIEEVADEPTYAPFIGGLGTYGPKPHRGPFIHVDTRGYRARWANP